MGENYRCHAGQCKIRDKYFVWNFARTDWLNKSCTMRVNDYERENEIKTVLGLILRWQGARERVRENLKTTCETQDVIIVSLDTVKW